MTQTSEEYRREQMTKRPNSELREIAAMECVVPLDHQLAQMAADELADRKARATGAWEAAHPLSDERTSE